MPEPDQKPPEEIRIVVQQERAPDPAWVTAYHNARSISWFIIFAFIMMWIGKTVF